MHVSTARHEVNEFREGFAELLRGKSFYLHRDVGFACDDILVVHEYDGRCRRRTGAFAIYRISWVARPGDHGGMLEGLLGPEAVVLALQPANVLLAGSVATVVVDAPGTAVSLPVAAARPTADSPAPTCTPGHNGSDPNRRTFYHAGSGPAAPVRT